MVLINKSEKMQKSFLENYVYEICPKLKEIDLFVKTTEFEMCVEDVASVLYMTQEKVRKIMCKNDIEIITKNNFFTVMEQGDSEICELYKRELDCGSPYIYSIENISYIYNLQLDIVNEACEQLHIKELTAYMLPVLFSNIVV